MTEADIHQAIVLRDDGTIEILATSDVPAGAVVVEGDLVGVAKIKIPAERRGNLTVWGLVDFPVKNKSDWKVGQRAYWDPASQYAVDQEIPGAKLLGKVVGFRNAAPFIRVLMNQ